MPKKYHIIRDPIHGFIKYNDLERNIIDSQPFQRLRNIKQLAFTHLIYPGAEHSRFSHSLGVMEFATKVFDTLIFKHKEEFGLAQEDINRNRQLLRLVTLLHDLGHPPFSHAVEDIFEKGLDHESYTYKIIEETVIKEIIDKDKGDTGITAENVVALYTGKPIGNSFKDVAFLKEIYSGDLDVDKMDYLLRDSLFSGVHYGKFDYERLISSLCLIQNPESEDGSLVLAVEIGGIHALEALILARYFMFTQLYFHRGRRAYDLHLLEFLKKEVKMYPVDIRSYLQWDDIKVIGLIREVSRNDDGQRILNRNHFVEAFATPEHSTEQDKTSFMAIKSELEGDKSVKIMFDEAEKAPHKFQITDLLIKHRDGKLEPVMKASHIIKNLMTIQQFRVYSSRENKNKINEFCKKF